MGSIWPGWVNVTTAVMSEPHHHTLQWAMSLCCAGMCVFSATMALSRLTCFRMHVLNCVRPAYGSEIKRSGQIPRREAAAWFASMSTVVGEMARVAGGGPPHCQPSCKAGFAPWTSCTRSVCSLLPSDPGRLCNSGCPAEIICFHGNTAYGPAKRDPNQLLDMAGGDEPSFRRG